ncbi:hypothetical protein PLESTB_000960600 [Pleodorina starrii]|uniref:Thioredoxin domain-containing protein n=1 Tax=Pleodorina starrii TaxID=330485 RepID=A0A9W6F476_9CHLO|nr:hypothetical protein PLESTM_001137500 [Pleodorina starrii]GLC55215.1 hypothetical protein PLESTB_000960600 [Pleodorina starrii]GLC71028.1 hypothetical protein PLESTF_001062400 [Pleodorina starrii]
MHIMATSSVGVAAKPTLWAKAPRQATRRRVRVFASSVSFCPHPDAVRRRQEAEALRQQRHREQSEAAMIQAMGLKWWEGTLPANMIAVATPRELETLTRQAFATGRAVLINYFQEDCYACRTLHKKLKQMALDNPEVLFLKVNGSNEALRPVFEEEGITKVPFFHCMRDGRVLSRFSASLNTEKLAHLRKEVVAIARAPQLVNA